MKAYLLKSHNRLLCIDIWAHISLESNPSHMSLTGHRSFSTVPVVGEGFRSFLMRKLLKSD